MVDEKDNMRLQILSQLVSRLSFAEAMKIYDGDRDFFDALGYPDQLKFENFEARYRRGDIAGTIVDTPALHAWKKPPILKDGDWSKEDDKKMKAGTQPTRTLFLQAWNQIVKNKHVFSYLSRLDSLSRLGRYAVLLVGASGADNLKSPLQEKSSTSHKELLYFSVFSEGRASISEFETDAKSPRYSLPLHYNLSYGDERGTVPVHSSRIVHAAERLTEDDIYGLPILERPFNRLIDLDKMVGGGAEGAWQTINRGIQADVREGYAMTPDEEEELEEQIQLYIHGQKSLLKTSGLDLKSLGAEVASPTSLADLVISLIAATVRIPKRILLGTEMGKLASSQDETNFAAEITSRQMNYLEPRILRPLIDRLVYCGCIPEPVSGEYEVYWPPYAEQSQNDRKTVAEAEKTEFEAYQIPKISRWRKMGLNESEIQQMLNDLDVEEGLGLFESPLSEGTPR